MKREELQKLLKSMMLVAAVSGVAFVGVACEESTEDAAEDAAEEVSEATEEAQADLMDQANKMAGDASAKLEEVKDKASEVAADMGIDLENLDQVDWSSITDGDAQALIDKLKSLINEGNIDKAKEMLAKLDGMSDQLPESVTSKLDGVRSLLDNADKLGDMKDQASGLLGGGEK